MELVEWCLEALAPDVAAVRDEATELRRAGVGPLELRALAFRLSQAEDESPALRRFFLELPGRKGLSMEAAWLGFRIVRTALLTSALFPDVPHAMVERLLRLAAFVLDPQEFRYALEGMAPPDLANRVGRLLEVRTRPLARLPDANAGRGSFQFLTVAAAAEVALAVFDQGPADTDQLVRVLSERGFGVLHLLSMASRADGSVAADENRVIRIIQECLAISEEEGADVRPDPTAQDLRALFPTEEERAGLVGALAMVIAADGEVDPREATMCRVVGMALGVSQDRVEELLERARFAAEAGG